MTGNSKDFNTRYKRSSKTVSGRLHDELVMMDLGRGKYFSLNPVATRIWDLLEEPHDINELCCHLLQEYDTDPDQCAKDVEDHLNEMERLGLVTRTEN